MKLQSGYPFSLIRYGLPYSYPKLTAPLKTDVAIIGGGISGALTAFHLNRAGIDCAVIDARSIGLGSTCASTSLLQYEIDVSLKDLIQKRGRKNAERSYLLCRASIGKLGAIASTVKLAEFATNRSLYYAAHKKDVTFLKEEFMLRKSIGLQVELLGDGDIREKFKFSAPAAILSADGAFADAYLLTHLIYQYCISKGLQVFDRTYINRIKHHKNKIMLTSQEQATITARKVVFATGYETTHFIDKKIVDLNSTYATVSEHMPDAGVVIDDDVMIWNTADPYLYLRKTIDGRVIVGGRDEGFSSTGKRDKLIRKKTKLLVKDFNRLFPETPFHPEFSWAGTFGSTKDGLPFIGQYSKFPDSYFALGFGGNGITFSLIAAEIITDLVKGKKNKDASIFSFDRV